MKLRNNVIHKVAKPFNLYTDHDVEQIQKLEKNMFELMVEKGGLGLAAPQLGIRKRMFVMNVDDKKYICINPIIIAVTDELLLAEEGCLSYPNRQFLVDRPEGITVSYNGNRHANEELTLNFVHRQEFSDLEARCFLHEFDHLNGVTADQRMERRVREKYLNYGIENE